MAKIKLRSGSDIVELMDTASMTGFFLGSPNAVLSRGQSLSIDMSGFVFVQVLAYPHNVGNGARSSPMVPAGLCNVAIPYKGGMGVLSISTPDKRITCESSSDCDVVVSSVVGWR